MLLKQIIGCNVCHIFVSMFLKITKVSNISLIRHKFITISVSSCKGNCLLP